MSPEEGREIKGRPELLSRPEMQGFQLRSPTLSPNRKEELLVIEVSHKLREEDLLPAPTSAAQTSGLEMEVPRGKKEEGGLTGERGGNGGGGGGVPVKQGEEKPAPPLPAVGCTELFRFAEGLDYVLMAIGTAGAIVHGCSLPVFLRFFADLVDSFGSNANNPDAMVREVVKVTIFSSS